MVRGLDVFKRYFGAYQDNYIVIGGTACDLIIGEAGFIPRATKDIDIILVVEALQADFVSQFWRFIRDGNYSQQEKSHDQRKYYRFTKPAQLAFPYQIELFARNPDLIDFDENAHLTPIPVEEDMSSLSAILLHEDYYHYLLRQSTVEDGLHRANIEALICLKAKAYLEIAERIKAGSTQEGKLLRKHKNDVFRLAVMLRGEDFFDLPTVLQTDMQEFVNLIKDDQPDRNIFKEMGFVRADPMIVFNRLRTSFRLQ